MQDTYEVATIEEIIKVNDRKIYIVFQRVAKSLNKKYTCTVINNR